MKSNFSLKFKLFVIKNIFFKTLLKNTLKNLDSFKTFSYNIRVIWFADMAQSVERRIGSAEVTGPIPVSSSENP